MASTAQFDFATERDWRVVACHRFPLSGAVGNVRGDGRYAAVTKCFRRWKVLLYQVAADRDNKLAEWQDRGCGPDCRFEHSAETLS